MGFEEGLRAWRSLLTPGGHVVVSEACWLRPHPPPACAAFWNAEYPAIRDVATIVDLIPSADHSWPSGYDLVAHFPLPASSWWDDYYAPLQQNIIAFRARHSGDADAQAVADQCQREIDVWHEHSAFYGYEFFVLREG